MSELPSSPWSMGNLARATVGHAATLKLPTPDTLQCIAQTGDGDWYTSQGMPQAPGATIEDSYFSLHRRGALLATMKVKAGGHATLFDRHPDGELVISWPSRGLIKLPFTPGTLKLDAGTPWAVGIRGSGVAFDHDHGTVMIYYANEMRVFETAAVDAGKPVLLYPPLKLPVGGRLRQGWTIWNDEALYLSGRSLSGQMIEVFDLNTGQLKYSRHARLLKDSATYPQEPEGIKVAGGKVFVGFTHGPRPYTHHIQSLSAYNGKLSTDSGQWYVDPAKVSTYLTGRNSSGKVTQKRPPGFPLWIRSISHKTVGAVARDWATTGYGTNYAAEFLTREKP